MVELETPRPIFWLVAVAGVVLCTLGATQLGVAVVEGMRGLGTGIAAVGVMCLGVSMVRSGRRAVGIRVRADSGRTSRR